MNKHSNNLLNLKHLLYALLTSIFWGVAHREETGEGEHFLNNGISDQKRNKNSVPAQNLYISDTMLKHLCIYLH